MVTATNALIAATGIDILRKNGNAMDAAIAMALTSSVILPDMCGIGGDSFFIYYEAETKKLFALNGSGYSGKNYDKNFYTKLGFDIIPEHGIHSISVPGTISALEKGLEKFGSMSFSDLCIDAIYYAEKGFPLGSRTRDYAIRRKGIIKQSSCLYDMFYDGENVRETNDIIINQALAESLKIIAKRGSQGFYHELAQKFVLNLNSMGADFELEDFSSYESEWVEPIKIFYKNHWIYQLPPVSQGIIQLEMHNILENFSLNEFGKHSADSIHLMVEAKKIAFKDRIALLGDPVFNMNPLDKLLNPEYGTEMAKRIDMKRTMNVKGLDLMPSKGNTTSFLVVDGMGNCCSFITSISDAFGSGIMDEETGILFNNRIGTNFNLVDDHPNSLEPRKKTMSTLMTYAITDMKNNCCYIGNTPGGDRQAQWNLQTITHLLDYKVDISEVFNQPYWYDAQTSNPYNKNTENILYLENSISDEVVRRLREKGHNIQLLDKVNSQNQVIKIDKNVYLGVSDWRSDGIAIGY
jgi:gamma-glutamyltranspeptidase / glutathione hydrolase